MSWDWKRIKPNQFPLIFSPRAAGSHSMYLVESGLNSSISKRNKHQHCTEYKLCKHVSIYRTEPSKTRFEKWKEQRDTESKVAHFSIITCSHNYQTQDKAVAVITLIALNNLHTLSLSALCWTTWLKMCNSSKYSVIWWIIKTLQKHLNYIRCRAYIWKETAHIPKSFNPPEN